MKIIKIKTSNAKGYLVVEAEEYGTKTVYTLSETQYSSVGTPLAGDVLDDGVKGEIYGFSEYNKYKKKALNILAFGDNSRKQLVMKLVRAGAKRNLASDIADEMKSLGYINEERQLEHLIEDEVNLKLNAPRKFIPKLAAKGYSADLIKMVADKLISENTISYDAARSKLLCKLGDDADKDEVKKILYKHGF